MRQPNWFDLKYGKVLEHATAEQALEVIAKDPKITQTVKDYLATFDKNGQRPGLSRIQVISSAIVTALQTSD